MSLRDMGYARRLILDEAPPAELLAQFGQKALVLWRGGGFTGGQRLRTLGEIHLFLVERDEVPAPCDALIAAEPVLSARRGGGLFQEQEPQGDTFAGIDDEVCTPVYLEAHVRALAARPLRPKKFDLEALLGQLPGLPRPEPERLASALELMGIPLARPLARSGTTPLRIAICDQSFAGLPALLGDDAEFKGLPRPNAPLDVAASTEPGHGTRMAAVVREALQSDVTLGLFRVVPDERSAPCAWLAPVDLALTLAYAVGEWEADLVLIAMSDGLWGMPRLLREVLRATQQIGRRGAGVPIFCSVGDSTRNHDAPGSGASYALGADDLASQPYVIAVASTDSAGRWYRRYNQTQCGPINRFGPAVALCAPGEFHRLGLLEGRLADDSSLAAALAVSAAALVLQKSPELTAAELRRVLQRTADVPPQVDEGPGPAADTFNAWDRTGHNFKLGAGRINALAAVLAAADPICDALLLTRARPGRVPTRGVTESDPAMLCARAWYGWTFAQDADTVSQEAWHLLVRYRELRGRLARLSRESASVQEALLWLARHLLALQHASEDDFDRDGSRGHGALLHRVEHLFETLRAEQRTPKEILSWLDALEPWLKSRERPGAAILRFLCGSRGTFSARWIPFTPL